MTGNDDLGTVSAWYVLSSLGLYPTMSGAGFFVLSTPQFPHAELKLGAIGSRQGGTLTIDAPGTDRGPALHRRGEPRRPAGPADVAHARRDRARRPAVVPRVGTPDALGHGALGGAAVGRPQPLGRPTESSGGSAP